MKLPNKAITRLVSSLENIPLECSSPEKLSKFVCKSLLNLGAEAKEVKGQQARRFGRGSSYQKLTDSYSQSNRDSLGEYASVSDSYMLSFLI